MTRGFHVTVSCRVDAAFGAVVTRIWIPAPRCPAGRAGTSPGKAEQVRFEGPLRQGLGDTGLRTKVARRDLGVRDKAGSSSLEEGALPLSVQNSPSPFLNLCWRGLGLEHQGADGGKWERCRQWEMQNLRSPGSLASDSLIVYARPASCLFQWKRLHGGVCRENGGP